MLNQILTHTPIYVWAILAFLVYRGVVAMRDRDLEVRKLTIIPIVMAVLSLQDMSAKFGLGGLSLAAWAVGVALAVAPVMAFGRTRIAAGSTPGMVHVRGSRVPLAMMMAVFVTKYAASVMLAVLPHARQDALVIGMVCALFGVLNGVFLGRLVRDLWTVSGLQAGAAVPARPI